jgi:hypothetical protein
LLDATGCDAYLTGARHDDEAEDEADEGGEAESGEDAQD